MEERRYTPGTWLDLATAGIRFGPDRAAVRRELAAHLEDKRADLRRRYPDLSEQEADELAAAQSSGRSWPGSISPGWGTCGG